jgi:hypothetical protein
MTSKEKVIVFDKVKKLKGGLKLDRLLYAFNGFAPSLNPPTPFVKGGN